ncbi:hypothetical protein [Bosea sp. LjRoot237]|uniref:hypothetical protein n=1 Tax=Bosea sp. LjRoot237 TaxID=3342292 RepID=UPI003ED0F590
MTPSDETPIKRRAPRRPRAPKDVLDFHLRWRDFRRFAKTTANRPELPEEERAVLRWLIELADRIGARDLR